MTHRQNKPHGAPKKHRSKNTGTRQAAPAKNRRKQSSVDPRLLSQKAVPQVVEEYHAPRSFADMPLHPELLKQLQRKGFQKPTEIQNETLEILLKCQDLLGVAQTGTGKTGAFLIPIINRLLSGEKHVRTLVLAPTRELAVQIQEEFKSLTHGLRFHSHCLIGGTNINRDLQDLQRPAHLVVGTPGRLLDLSQRGAINFKEFETLVLDEFDRMLDMGFSKDVNRITGAMTRRKHTMLFSATLDKMQQPYIDKLLHKPREVKVSTGEATGQNIDQSIIKLNEGEDKFARLLSMVREEDFHKVLIFAETKRWVSKVHKKLGQAGVKSDEIHGNKTQNYRQKALDKFKKGKVQVLVATDVAARGLDVSDITHVINYQLPGSMDSYIHRIGRTGRAGKTGKAYTFIN